MKTRKIIVSAIACLGIIGTSYGWIHEHDSNRSLRTQVQTSESNADHANQSFRVKQEQTQKQFQATANRSTDPKVSSTFIQNQATNQASPNITKFFRTYYSFEDSQQYNDRNKQLLQQGIITNQVAHDHDLFGNDKIISGMNYVDTVQLNSYFVSAYEFLPSMVKNTHTGNILTQVKYQSEYSDQKPVTTTIVYRISYDFQTGKITSVNQDATLFNNTQTLSSLKDNGILTNY